MVASEVLHRRTVCADVSIGSIHTWNIGQLVSVHILVVRHLWRAHEIIGQKLSLAGDLVATAE